jgi:hypothetical protein
MGFGLGLGFIGPLQIITTSNSSAITNSHTLQFTKTHTKSSQFAIFTGCLVMATNTVDPSVFMSLMAGDGLTTNDF